MSRDVLDAADPEELTNISALHVALGRAFRAAHKYADSALCYHHALRVSTAHKMMRSLLRAKSLTNTFSF